jgi:hypothetical protein
MTTYILFIFGKFEDHDDIEFFCMNVLGELKSISSLKYVIDNLHNVIIIFDSESKEAILMNDIDDLLNNQHVLFYFMFKKENLISSYIPEEMAHLIFKPSTDILKIELKMMSPKQKKEINLDDILDKIDRNGIESLNAEEKKFLDNFEN